MVGVNGGCEDAHRAAAHLAWMGVQGGCEWWVGVKMQGSGASRVVQRRLRSLPPRSPAPLLCAELRARHARHALARAHVSHERHTLQYATQAGPGERARATSRFHGPCRAARTSSADALGGGRETPTSTAGRVATRRWPHAGSCRDGEGDRAAARQRRWRRRRGSPARQ